jgi:DNA-binding response OmpR family regulator
MPLLPSSGPPDDTTPVALVSWPEDESSRRRLAAARQPRLLLIAPGVAPPVLTDELEDWIRFPLDPDELAVRMATLVARAGDVEPRPAGLVLDGDGVLHCEDRWVSLPPTEARVLAELLGRPGHAVHRADLAAVAWPAGLPADERALDGVIKRLRRRVAPLGVRIHTVNKVGFLVDSS